MKKKTKFNKLDSKRYSILDNSTGEILEPVNSTLYTAAVDDGLIFDSRHYFTGSFVYIWYLTMAD
jgi:hypothetical protein